MGMALKKKRRKRKKKTATLELGWLIEMELSRAARPAAKKRGSGGCSRSFP
jgi:hypothetical protein